MPMFARKYKMACSDCHDALTFPRLNKVGYKFRRAGFRMPEQIGQDELTDYNLSDAFSARIQARYTVSHTSDDRTAASTSKTSNTFEMREITLYPITGSFMKYFASETEMSFAPDEPTELENAYLRGVHGNQNSWFEARIGLWHPFEGFGGSDRPLGQSRPFFETQGANQVQDTLVRIWGIDQVGAEVGGQLQDTSLSIAVHNGLNTEVEGGNVVGVGITPDQDQQKDVLVFFNQILGDTTGVSAYYSHGRVHLPTDPAAFVDGTSEETYADNWDRMAVFGSFGMPVFTAMAGGELGVDQARDPVSGNRSRFKSWGTFVEGDVALAPFAVGYLRLDYFDPSSKKDENQMMGAALGASIFHDWVYLTPELQLKSTKGAEGSKVDTTGMVHAVVIY